MAEAAASSRSFAVGKFGQHYDELLEVDQAVAVRVDFSDDFRPDLIL